MPRSLTMKDDPATRFIAAKVIELAQRGIRDPASMLAILRDHRGANRVRKGSGRGACDGA